MELSSLNQLRHVHDEGRVVCRQPHSCYPRADGNDVDSVISLAPNLNRLPPGPPSPRSQEMESPPRWLLVPPFIMVRSAKRSCEESTSSRRSRKKATSSPASI